MRIPLFPLHLVAYPGTRVPLQVFEPRYRAMMEHVLSGERRFGIACISRGMEVGGSAEVHRVGVLTEIEQVQRASNGSMALVTVAHHRFRIDVRLPDDPYPAAEITLAPDTEGDGAAEALTEARAALKRYLSVVARMTGEEIVVPPAGDDPIAASYAIASALQVDLPLRQTLLEATDAATRLREAALIARRESILLDAVGPSVGRPGAPSQN